MISLNYVALDRHKQILQHRLMENKDRFRRLVINQCSFVKKRNVLADKVQVFVLPYKSNKSPFSTIKFVIFSPDAKYTKSYKRRGVFAHSWQNKVDGL